MAKLEGRRGSKALLADSAACNVHYTPKYKNIPQIILRGVTQELKMWRSSGWLERSVKILAYILVITFTFCEKESCDVSKIQRAHPLRSMYAISYFHVPIRFWYFVWTMGWLYCGKHQRVTKNLRKHPPTYTGSHMLNQSVVVEYFSLDKGPANVSILRPQRNRGNNAVNTSKNLVSFRVELRLGSEMAHTSKQWELHLTEV